MRLTLTVSPSELCLNVRVERWPAPLRVLFQRQFGFFVGGNALSLTGTWMQRIACSWLIWEWTGSAFWLGVLAACDLMPVVLVGPLAGVAADRWDRLKQNKLAQILTAILALAFALLLVVDKLTIVPLLVGVTLQGILIAAVQPARLAMVQEMVPRADVMVAVGLNSVTVNLARLLGPAAAGLIILQLDITWVFALNAMFTLIFVLVLGRLKLAPREIKPAKGSFLWLMREGFVHVARTPALRVILGMLFLGGVLVRSMLELVPAVAALTFTNTTSGLAILTAAAAFGAVVSGLTIRSGASERMLKTVVLWWGLGAVAAAVLTQAPVSSVAIIAAAVMGAAITRGMVGAQTLVQLTTPDTLLGRVLSVHGLIARSSPALGALAIGFSADRFGLPSTVTVTSIIFLAIVIILVFYKPEKPSSPAR